VLIPGRPREVYDVTGAGDTFVAHLALGWMQGLSAVESAAWANLAAGIVVERLGVSVVTPRELGAEVEGDRRWAKHCTARELERVVRAHRAAGERVVFTNGCFDLLHVGHIRLLESARALGDCLVVAINSDASVRRLKGPPRPLLPESERVALLAALNCVDRIVVFDEASPEKLIRTLKPDILVKGGNLEPDEVVGREIVEGYGGEIRLLPLFGDRSVSQFLGRLGKSAEGGERAEGSVRKRRRSTARGRRR
jgi:D-beta-D-heptose 7-phosphate kinase/D-beta-D-heptose 1-phosphate adenosyltransferase